LAKFFLGFTYYNYKDKTNHIHSDACTFIYSGVSYSDNRERVFIFAYDTKENDDENTSRYDLYLRAVPPHTNQIASCFDALSITYKLNFL
jgi:hypothetical protein